MKRTILYNLNESEKAISSGRLTGKGYLEGTRTIGNFVPEQHSDYIFSTVGEEWGFVGSSFIIILYIIFGLNETRFIFSVTIILSIIFWLLYTSIMSERKADIQSEAEL